MTELSFSADSRRLRAGIVGGGQGAFIGAVHRIAAELDGQAQVVAGVLSSDAQRSMASAREWRLARCYDDFTAMARNEAADPEGIDFVIVATPNHLHYPVAKAFMEAGIHVICDKPLALTVEEAEDIARISTARPVCFALTHPYSAYPLIEEARAKVAAGELGEVRRVVVEYQQDWLREPLEHTGHKQAGWRTDPARAGLGGCIGDIGTHAQHLLEYVAGLQIKMLCADLTSFVPGRRLDDDANLLLRLEGGAKGILTCSQIACGEENNLTLRIYGTLAGLEWRQQEPNSLLWKPAGAPSQVIRAGGAYTGPGTRAATRTPAGHPEGYLEAFANVYRRFMTDLRRVAAGMPLKRDYPGVAEGLRGMKFIRAAVESSERGAIWVDLP